MMKLSKLVLMATTIGAAGSFASVVAAEATTNSPGSTCVPQGSGQLMYRVGGEAENQTASEVTAMCPVERKWSSGTLASKLSARVWVFDQSTQFNVCCHVASRNPGGSSVSGIWTCTSGNSASAQSLDLAQITDSSSYSHFLVECDLPPPSAGKYSAIHTFRAIQE
jgi:hypothetical protein